MNSRTFVTIKVPLNEPVRFFDEPGNNASMLKMGFANVELMRSHVVVEKGANVRKAATELVVDEVAARNERQFVLPAKAWTKIYQYDATYHSIYRTCTDELKKLKLRLNHGDLVISIDDDVTGDRFMLAACAKRNVYYIVNGFMDEPMAQTVKYGDCGTVISTYDRGFNQALSKRKYYRSPPRSRDPGYIISTCEEYSGDDDLEERIMGLLCNVEGQYFDDALHDGDEDDFVHEFGAVISLHKIVTGSNGEISTAKIGQREILVGSFSFDDSAMAMLSMFTATIVK